MAKSYYSKAELLDFGSFVVSDERRRILQEKARNEMNKGAKNILPYSARERMINEDDFKLWKNRTTESEAGQLKLILHIKTELQEALKKDGEEVLVEVMNVLTNLKPIK